MRFSGRTVFFSILFIALVALLLAGVAPGAAAARNLEDPPDTLRLRVRAGARLELEFPGSGGTPDTCDLWGTIDISSQPPFPSLDFPPHLEVDSSFDSLNLFGRGSGTRVGGYPYFKSHGKAYLLDPEPWVESFFDVFFELEHPEHAPGETLWTHVPVRIYGMAHGWPPYFDRFSSPPGMPPVPLFTKGGIEAGQVLSFELEMLPYYEPAAHLIVPTAYRSEVALVGADGLVRISAGLAGEHTATEAIFGFRPCGAPGPFETFAVDLDGSAPRYATVYPMGSGDGWSGYFDPGWLPPEGMCIEFEAALLVPPYGYFMDTVAVWVDRTPPIPVFHDIPRDSIALFAVESFFDVTFRLDDELPDFGFSELLVFPLQPDFHRQLTVIDQLGLGTDLDSVSCGPTAVASCLKYFADNGYPGLDNPGGDESRPNQSGEEIARELQGAMGTDTSGTTDAQMVAGIKSYLGSRGQDGWSVESHPVDDATGLAEMLREFESDGEDVIVALEGTDADGDTMAHAVTLGSSHSTCHNSGSGGTPEIRIDFMDPFEGGSQAENEYPVDVSGGGQPSTAGYNLDDEGSDAKIVGYVKVSPPEGGEPPALALRSAAARGGWIVVDSGPVRGNGLVDTLRWDTSPFPGGLYLMEIVTTNHLGLQCRDIRLVGIPVITTGAEESGPPIKTMLRSSYPNPFNPATTIEYSLAAKTAVTLAIYDVAGRRVRVLLRGEPVEAGVHTIDWDGRSDSGRLLASGVYFAKFQAEDQFSARKLILLR